MDYEFGSEGDGTRTDKTSLINFAMTQSNATTGKSIMVGDRHYDIVGAKNNGFPSVGVIYKYGGYEEYETAGATRLISRPTDLYNAIAAVLG